MECPFCGTDDPVFPNAHKVACVWCEATGLRWSEGEAYSWATAPWGAP